MGRLVGLVILQHRFKSGVVFRAEDRQFHAVIGQRVDCGQAAIFEADNVNRQCGVYPVAAAHGHQPILDDGNETAMIHVSQDAAIFAQHGDGLRVNARSCGWTTLPARGPGAGWRLSRGP